MNVDEYINNLTKDEHLRLFNKVKDNYEEKYLRNCVLVGMENLTLIELVNYFAEDVSNDRCIVYFGKRENKENLINKYKGLETDAINDLLIRLNKLNIINLKIKDRTI